MKKILPLFLLPFVLVTNAQAHHAQWWELVDPSQPYSSYHVQQDEDPVFFDEDQDYTSGTLVQTITTGEDTTFSLGTEPRGRIEIMRRDYRRQHKIIAKSPKNPVDAIQTSSIKAPKLSKPLTANKPVPQQTSTPASCQKASAIVASFGFETIVPKTCTGAILSFSATRSGKPFEVTVVAATGELGAVKKL